LKKEKDGERKGGNTRGFCRGGTPLCLKKPRRRRVSKNVGGYGKAGECVSYRQRNRGGTTVEEKKKGFLLGPWEKEKARKG